MLNFRAPVRGGSGMLGGPEAPTQTAVYGPVRTVVWQGSVGDRRPYADQRVFCKLSGGRDDFLGGRHDHFPAHYDFIDRSKKSAEVRMSDLLTCGNSG